MRNRSLAVSALLTLAAFHGCATQAASVAGNPRCPDTVQAKVGPAKPSVTVSYTEPSVKPAGNEWQGLAKTTIYYDLGTGRIVAKEIPATTPTGGGQVKQTIAVPLPERKETTVRICVTATDRRGNESAMTQ
jgi:hypothetical protein